MHRCDITARHALTSFNQTKANVRFRSNALISIAEQRKISRPSPRQHFQTLGVRTAPSPSLENEFGKPPSIFCAQHLLVMNGIVAGAPKSERLPGHATYGSKFGRPCLGDRGRTQSKNGRWKDPPKNMPEGKEACEKRKKKTWRTTRNL